MTDPMFYCEHLPAPGECAQLREDEARHAGASRRLKQGDSLWLFDGRGAIARATLGATLERGRAIEVRIEERQQQAAPAPALHLACALPKGDRAAILLDMATQLGVTSFTPLLCERSVVDPGAGTLERLRRVCLEACKQSRRAILPPIHEPMKLDDVLAQAGTIWIAHPGGKPVTELPYTDQHPLTLLVGPEGGFSDEEIARVSTHGAQRVSLGETVLRVEAAAVALLAALRIGRVPGTANQAS